MSKDTALFSDRYGKPPPCPRCGHWTIWHERIITDVAGFNQAIEKNPEKALHEIIKPYETRMMVTVCQSPSCIAICDAETGALDQALTEQAFYGHRRFLADEFVTRSLDVLQETDDR